ncbi:hypothetical protein ARMGADRAFT_1035692 [Armillaria gallica]|uniref:Uncharacterized protein n=1 Tax=Armillaria gallica TaxID=47427 RepID=A0A2H3D603_ARMGA|nr:hypothetical protein ARMGADRAFT_1035692 [Armillaria gallica]
MSLNDPEVYYKSIKDVVGSLDKARVVNMLVLFKTMDVPCGFLRPPGQPHHPSYDPMTLTPEELYVLRPLTTWCRKLSEMLVKHLVVLSKYFPLQLVPGYGPDIRIMVWTQNSDGQNIFGIQESKMKST